jgi:uncharacterized protein YdaU (DUF1376 family)
LDWYPKYPADYRHDTWRLSLAAHGAYNLIIDYYMHSEAPPPNEDRALASIVGVTIEEWLVVRPEIESLFQTENGSWRHKRCDRELKTAFDRRKDGKKRQERFRSKTGP